MPQGVRMLAQISVILAAFALMEKSWGGNAYSLPGIAGEAGEEQETHAAPLNTREKLAGFYVSSCEFEKEVAGMLNTKDSAFQEALLKRGFLTKKEVVQRGSFSTSWQNVAIYIQNQGLDHRKCSHKDLRYCRQQY